MLLSGPMRFFPLIFLGFLAAACGGSGSDSASADHQSEWLKVLHRKKAAATPGAPVEAKQAYADSLSAFVRNHPQHSRGREVYQRVRLEFADELSELGRYHDAVRFYRAVLAEDPANAQARNGLARAVDRLAVSREKLLLLDKGMSQREVARVLGKPLPGWTARRDRPAGRVEAWYYRTAAGRVAGVYFRDGKLFAAEEQSDAKVARWNAR